MKRSRAEHRRYLPGSPFNVPVPDCPVETFAVHDQVTHDKYGLGVVLGVEGDTAVLVDFGTHKVRVAIPCAKLIKL
jgi:hypothetical protein